MNGQTVHWSGERARRADGHFNSGLRRRFDTGVFRHILPALRSDSTVLDLGAGTGFLSIPVAAHLKHGKVIAVDESEEMLVQLARRAEKTEYADRIELCRADASETELPEGSIDLVLSANLLHEVPNPQGVLKEILRVLKPGVMFVIQDFRNGLFWKIFRRFHPEAANGPLKIAELTSALEKAGFKEIVVQTKSLRYIASGRKPNGT